MSDHIASIDDDIDAHQTNGAAHGAATGTATAPKPAKARIAKTKAKPVAAAKAKPTAVTKTNPSKEKPKGKGKSLDLKEVESELRKKYSSQKIVDGSLRDVGQLAAFPNKRSVEIICGTKNCGTKRRIATSDLHQTRFCEDCTKNNRNKKSGDAKPAKTKRKTKREPATADA